MGGVGLMSIAMDGLPCGGGVMKSWALLQPPMERVVRERTRLIPSAQQIPIVKTMLDLSAGYIGAAKMMFLASN
jgi:hypothetical protein